MHPLFLSFFLSFLTTITSFGPVQIKGDLDDDDDEVEEEEKKVVSVMALHRGLANISVWLKSFLNTPLRFLLLLFILVIVL